jgi:hypothetical protein
MSLRSSEGSKHWPQSLAPGAVQRRKQRCIPRTSSSLQECSRSDALQLPALRAASRLQNPAALRQVQHQVCEARSTLWSRCAAHCAWWGNVAWQLSRLWHSVNDVLGAGEIASFVGVTRCAAHSVLSSICTPDAEQEPVDSQRRCYASCTLPLLLAVCSNFNPLLAPPELTTFGRWHLKSMPAAR